MSLIDSMQMLKNDIKSARQKRRQVSKAIKEETRQLQRNTHKFLADAERTRKEEANREKRELIAFTRDLTDDVANLRREFRREKADVEREIKGAADIWKGKAQVAIKEEKKEKEKEEE